MAPSPSLVIDLCGGLKIARRNINMCLNLSSCSCLYWISDFRGRAISYLGQEVRHAAPLTGPVRPKTKEAVNVPVPSIRERLEPWRSARLLKKGTEVGI